LPFLTCLIVVPIMWQVVEQGDEAGVPWARAAIWWLAWLPRGKWARAWAIGGVGMVVGSALLLGALTLLGVTAFSAIGAILFKASYSAGLAALVTPLLGLASWADVSQAMRQRTGVIPHAIPVAQLPSVTDKNHRAAMQRDMIGYLEAVAGQGNFLRIPLFGPVYAYLVNDPALIREVLVAQAEHFHKPFTVKYTAKQLGIDNVFTSDGELWQILRKAMQPAFHTRRIENYAGIMVDHTEEMLAGWADGQRVDIPAAMMELTLGITTRALFGKDMRGDQVAAAIVRFIALFSERIAGLPIPGWLPTRTNRELKQLVATGNAWLEPLIAERKADPHRYDDVLAMLIEAQRADTTGLLTDQQVRSEVTNLFAAGYEVVAHTLAFTLYLVAEHPDVAARIHDELARVLGGQPPTAATLGELTYLDLVIKESMRLLPVTTVLSRQTCAPVTLREHTLPKDRLVLFSPWLLQRDPQYFPDPLAFRPERFDPEAGQAINRYAYLPFSSGPRVCIGNAFALMQMKINLALIWQRYQLQVAPGYTFAPLYQFNTRPKGGLPMVVMSESELRMAQSGTR
jgi:cytochrome P450